MPPLSYEENAIVLATRDHGESDKIITFISADSGKFSGIAKGANRSRKRFVNKLELFSFLKLTLSRRKGAELAFIHDALLHESFIHIRQDITAYYTATLLRESLLTTLPEHQADPDIFRLFTWALSSLNQHRPHLAVIAIFLIRFYERLGYCPNLSSCTHCGLLFSRTQKYSFQYAGAGLICRECLQAHDITGNSSELSSETLQLLRSALSEPLERLGRLRFSPLAAQQALQLLRRYGRTLFQRDLQSWKVILT